MATITATRTTYKNTGAVTDCQCLRIVRKDGVILRMTDAAEDLTMTTYIDGSGVSQTLPAPVTYKSIGYVATASDGGEDMAPGTIDIEGIITATGIARNDIKNGLFNQARVYVFYTNYKIPVEDEEKILSGFWAEATIKDGTYSITFKSLIDVLNTHTGTSYSPTCTNRLGDGDCGVITAPASWAASTAYVAASAYDAKIGSVVKPTVQNGWNYLCTIGGTSAGSQPTWPTSLSATVADGSVTWKAIYPRMQEGTVTSSANRYSFVDNARTEPDGWFNNGKIVFNSGSNSGVTADVKTSVSATNVITLKQTLKFDILPSDTYTITVGCQKRITEDCTGKFSNVYNNQSYPYMPGQTAIGKFGGQ